MPALATLLFGAALMQEKSNLSAAYDACMARAGGVTVEIRTCTSQEHGRQDSRLNATYRELMRGLRKTAVQASATRSAPGSLSGKPSATTAANRRAAAPSRP